MTLRRLACERGEVAITQLLMAMTIFVFVLCATLLVFETFVTINRDTGDRNEAQDRARQAIESMGRELRNLASPTQDQPQAVDKAGAFDMVFQTVDSNGPNTGLNASNVRRVRYCVNSATRMLWKQYQTWTSQTAPAVPSTATCPAAAWNSQTLMADKVVNASRTAFTYNSATLTDISSIHVDVFVDPDETRAPAETRVSTGVFLRNQNRRPAASFTAVTSGQGLVLNGSGSTDPEGEPLTYQWFDGTTKVGTGIVFTYAVAASSSHTITLKVYDPAALEGVAPSQAVTA